MGILGPVLAFALVAFIVVGAWHTDAANRDCRAMGGRYLDGQCMRIEVIK